MRILLVSIHPYPSPQAMPLANAFLQSYLSNDSPEITITNFFVGQETVHCVDAISAQQPDAVGFSMYVWNREMCIEIARELHSRMPGLTLFAGGPEPTADMEGVMTASSFNFLIAGEGEKPFAEVCNRLITGASVAHINGVALREEGGPVFTPQTPLADLDAIPSPYLQGILNTDRYQGILWQLSRGCGFSCDFCFDSLGSGGVRRFSLERIEAELRHFASKGVSQVFVLDSTFNQDAARAKKILRLIKKIAPYIHFHFEVRSEFIDREMARLFADITCSLQIGLQSSNAEALKGVGRAFDRNDFMAKAALLNEAGAVFGFDLIYGLPGDTPKSFAQSLDFALGLYPNHLDIFPLAILPGTSLAARSSSIGLCRLTSPPYTLISSPTFAPEEMGCAKRLADACDIFYNRGKAVAWFNGVIAPLGIKPSVFLQEFGEWLASEKGAGVTETELDDHEIWELQRGFLKREFSRSKKERLLPLVLDLVDYHYHYAASLMTPSPIIPTDRELEGLHLLDIPSRLAPSTRLAVFHYEILDILEAGEPDIKRFAGHHPQNGSWAAIYPHDGEIFTESLIEPYFRLLEQLDGRVPAGRIAHRLGIPSGDALSFLEFAAAEGIILLPR